MNLMNFLTQTTLMNVIINDLKEFRDSDDLVEFDDSKIFRI